MVKPLHVENCSTATDQNVNATPTHVRAECNVSGASTAFRPTQDDIFKLVDGGILPSVCWNTPPNNHDNMINPPQRNDNAITSSRSTNVWNPYEALTLDLKPPCNNLINPPDRNENAILPSKPLSPSTPWSPYEALTLDLRAPINTCDKAIVPGGGSSGGLLSERLARDLKDPEFVKRYESRPINNVDNAILPPAHKHRPPDEQVRDAKKIQRLYSYEE